MEKVMEAIYKRKSTRNFSDRKIEGKILNEILSAGLQAPSPKNDQPWSFLVVEQEEKRHKVADILECHLEKIKTENSHMGIFRDDILSAFESVRILEEAPVLVFVYLDPEKCEGHDDNNIKWKLNARDSECTHIMAIGAAIQNILLAATIKGVDSLWLGDIFFAYNSLQEYLGQGGCVMAAIALGYGMENTGKKMRKEFKEVVKYF